MNQFIVQDIESITTRDGCVDVNAVLKLVGLAQPEIDVFMKHLTESGSEPKLKVSKFNGVTWLNSDDICTVLRHAQIVCPHASEKCDALLRKFSSPPKCTPPIENRKNMIRHRNMIRAFIEYVRSDVNSAYKLSDDDATSATPLARAQIFARSNHLLKMQHNDLARYMNLAYIMYPLLRRFFDGDKSALPIKNLTVIEVFRMLEADRRSREPMSTHETRCTQIVIAMFRLNVLSDNRLATFVCSMAPCAVFNTFSSKMFTYLETTETLRVLLDFIEAAHVRRQHEYPCAWMPERAAAIVQQWASSSAHDARIQRAVLSKNYEEFRLTVEKEDTRYAGRKRVRFFRDSELSSPSNVNAATKFIHDMKMGIAEAERLHRTLATVYDTLSHSEHQLLTRAMIDVAKQLIGNKK